MRIRGTLIISVYYAQRRYTRVGCYKLFPQVRSKKIGEGNRRSKIRGSKENKARICLSCYTINISRSKIARQIERYQSLDRRLKEADCVSLTTCENSIIRVHIRTCKICSYTYVNACTIYLKCAHGSKRQTIQIIRKCIERTSTIGLWSRTSQSKKPRASSANPHVIHIKRHAAYHVRFSLVSAYVYSYAICTACTRASRCVLS